MPPDLLSSAARTPALPTGPAFDIVLLAHVSCVVIGLLTVVVSGSQASRLLGALGDVPGTPANAATGPSRTTPDQRAAREISLGRYYAPGSNWAGRTLYGVPVFGFVLIGLSHGAYGLDQGWVMSGLGLWVLVVGAAEGLLWPAERRIGLLLDARPSGPGMPDDPRGALAASDRRRWLAGAPVSTLRRECRRVQVLTALLVVSLVVAVVLMVAKP